MSSFISANPRCSRSTIVPILLKHGRPAGRKSRSMAGAAVTSTEQLLKVYDYDALTESDTKKLIQRPRIDFSAILDTVAPIITAVQERGDAAVREFTSKFDKVDLEAVCVPIDDIPMPSLPAHIEASFDIAYENIYNFHKAQEADEISVDTMPGVTCRQLRRPIEAVGVYVPGGTAVLPSSTLMLATPAQLAGCKTIVMATPPFKGTAESPGATEGGPLIPPEVAYCAKKAGVTHVLAAGGAQAVAAMAWGTETCPKVDKLFGPGNQFVTAAKMALQSSEAMVAIDMPAGPSEVLVIADEGAPPSHVAADLLSQAEHGPDSQVVLVTLPGADVAAIEAQVNEQLSTLPRSDAALTALTHSFAVRAPSREAACAFSNRYAPEHLIINTADAEEWLPGIDHAGSVFLGRWTPESVGDYASGTNHVLPTYGYARMYSGVNADAFSKKMTVQTLTEAGLRVLGPCVENMAEVEGLMAHKRAVSLRLADL